MTRQQAVNEFGSVKELAAALKITPQAIYQWPEKLDQAQVDRIRGALLRLGKLRVAPAI